MLYTVGEVAKILNVAPSTLRYYDKEGLLPFVERSNKGVRMFRAEDFEWLYIINCLKKTGLSIKDIKSFVDMLIKGDETIEQRLKLFLNQRENVLAKISELQDTLNILDYKCWYYETAQKKGSTETMKNIEDKDLPEKFRKVKKQLENINKK